MSVQLNHTIVSCRDQQRSASFLTGILGLAPATHGANRTGRIDFATRASGRASRVHTGAVFGRADGRRARCSRNAIGARRCGFAHSDRACCDGSDGD